MIQLTLYQYYGELFFIRKQKNIVNQALIRRYQICYTLQKTTHYRRYVVNHITSQSVEEPGLYSGADWVSNIYE